ncbi:PfaD family polyunsaturated fatty acid/polyketide biosynthesis protein [Candidatus Sumerlaeota bacterium]|nr:PfaD family polyunsaturated fatty acid/polyketide biosynthesis protein [Candidatus Sumerlaeota bacterium]
MGWWTGDGQAPSNAPDALRDALRRISQPVFVLRDGEGALLTATTGSAQLGPADSPPPGALPLLAWVAPCPIEGLGSRSFCAEHAIRWPYVAGSMANGIASCEMVEAMARAGMLAFFGAGGLTPSEVEAALDRLESNLGNPDDGGLPYGSNLLHSPNEPEIEAAVADLYIRRGIRLVEASAYLDMTLPLIRYRVHGIHRAASGEIVAPNRVVAKVSRVEVATKFFSSPPEAFLRELAARGDITQEQAELASQIPVAQNLTAEADSGGHTDNRPAIALLPTMLALRDRFASRYAGRIALRVGAGGGIATPASAAAAFSMGAAYVVTGSVNQACVESGTSPAAREMLAQAEQADVAMAPAADMFEMGVHVQVLKRGTMFAMRAAKLYEIYRARKSLDEIPVAERAMLEKNVFRAPLDEVWHETRKFFADREPGQIERAEKDPRHKMALVFRWYLGLSPRWANSGDPSRRLDYQIWCGPAMGAFNEWAKSSFLETVSNRRVADVALNILYGAAVLVRANSLRWQGIDVPAEAMSAAPMEMRKIEKMFGKEPR